MSAEPLLRVSGLRVRYPAAEPPVEAVAGIDLALDRGRSLGLVGESGAGKSQLALAIPGLLPKGARVEGSIRLDGTELQGAAPALLERFRGGRVGVVFQDPQLALTPHLTIGTQLIEALRAHRDVDAAQARREALTMLARVQVPDPQARIAQYPHELSGGLRQRVLIGIALMAGPDLLIADEPTTALDVTVEAEILALFARLRAELGLALLLISHDLAVVASLCDEIAVLYAGRVVESGPAWSVLESPLHPYSAALAAATSSLAGAAEAPVVAIPGSAPGPGERPAGCAFQPRCSRAIERCRREPPPLLKGPEPGTEVACFRPLERGRR